MMARVDSHAFFADASADLSAYARLDVTPKQIQRVAEEVGRAATKGKALDLDRTQQSHCNGLLDMGRSEDILSEDSTHIEKLSLSAGKRRKSKNCSATCGKTRT